MPARPGGGAADSEKTDSPPATLPALLLEPLPKPRRLLVSHHLLRFEEKEALVSAMEEAPSLNPLTLPSIDGRLLCAFLPKREVDLDLVGVVVDA